MSKQFDLHKLIKEEMAKLALEEQAIVKIKLDDITFDDIVSTFKNKHYKRKMSDIGDGIARYHDGVSFPQASDSMLNISDPTLLDNWKEEIKKEYGNVELVMDPSQEWFHRVKITDPKFVKDKQDAVDRKGRLMRESGLSESKLFAALEKSGNLKEPNGGASMNGKYYQLEGDSKYDVIHFDYKPNDNKPFGVAQVAGHHMPAQILRKLGFRETNSWTAGVEIYIFDGNFNPKYISEAEMMELVEGWSKGASSYAKTMAGFYKDRGRTSGTIDESNKKHVKALLEARVKQVNIIKEGVMAELDLIMDEASDFKDFLRRINRDSRLETSLLNSPDMLKFFTKIWKESGRSL